MNRGIPYPDTYGMHITSWKLENAPQFFQMSESVAPVSPGKVTLEDFTLIKVIGKGTYGKVMLVRHKKVIEFLHVANPFVFLGQCSVRHENVAKRARREEESGRTYKDRA